MAHSDLTVEAGSRGIKPLTLSRRGALGLLGVALVGGCTTEADRTNQTFFDAVRKDPLYQWRPAWVIRTNDFETPIGGPYPDSGPRLRHSKYAVALPATAVADSMAEALATGWQDRGDSYGYIKPIKNSNLGLWLLINVNQEFQSVDMEFLATKA